MPRINQTAKSLRKTLGLRTSENDSATTAYAIVNPKTKQPVLSANIYGGVTNNGHRGWKEDFGATDTVDQVSVILPSGLVASGATGIVHHIYTPGGNILGWAPLGAGQTLKPSINADGLDIACDQTSTEGSEIFTHFVGATGRPFTVGSDPAFYMKAKVLIGDVSGLTSFCIGFRRAQVNASALATYLDYSGLGCNTSAAAMAIKQLTGLNDTDTVTDTTQTLADATSYTVQVNVSAAGVVTFLHDAASSGGALVAPTAVAAFTHDDGDCLIPFIFALQGADLADTCVIQAFEAGYQ